MTDFTIDSKATGGIDTRWRAGRLGADEGRPGQLKLSTFVDGTHYNIGNSFNTIPSGVAVAEHADGEYVPWDPTAGAEGDYRRVLAGYINDDEGIALFRREGVAKSTKSTFSLLIVGIIDPSVLPIAAQRAAVAATRTSGLTTGSFTYL